MEPKIQRVFKVCYVSQLGGTYYSAMKLLLTRSVSVKYTIGKVSRPKIDGSYLLAFTTFARAREWMLAQVCVGDTRILECEASISDNQDKPILALGASKRENAGRISLHQRNCGGNWSILFPGQIEPPDGTIFCNWIKPLRVIK